MFHVPTKIAIEKEMMLEFQREDPWNFEASKYEIGRFEKMLEFVQSVPHKSILEIGCAEGFFTKKLLDLGSDVTAIDISPMALARAKKHAPTATFIKSSLEDLDIKQKFDVVVCSETIYYTYDRVRAMKNIKKYGRYLVSSNIFLHKLKPCSAEFIFRSLPFPKLYIHVSFREMKFCFICLRILG